MKIIINQFKNKIHFKFYSGNIIVYKCAIDKAEEFLICIDKLIKKHHTVKISSFRNVKLEFHDTGLLTERVIRAIVGGFEVDT